MIPQAAGNCVAAEERAGPARFSCSATTPACPGSISGPTEDVTRWLSVQKCLV